MFFQEGLVVSIESSLLFLSFRIVRVLLFVHLVGCFFCLDAYLDIYMFFS